MVETTDFTHIIALLIWFHLSKGANNKLRNTCEENFGFFCFFFFVITCELKNDNFLANA